MKKYIYFLLFVFWCTLLHSQNIVVDGVTFSADGKTLVSYSVKNTMEEYIIPEGVKKIDKNAFRNATVHRITLPSTLDTIGDSAFKSCANLNTVTWKNYPSVVGRYIFDYSGVDTFLTLEDSQNCIAIDGILFSKDQKTLLCFPRLRCENLAVVPEGVEVIGAGAFEGGEIWNVVLPSSIIRIEDYAFWLTMRVPTTKFMEYICLNSVSCQALVPPTIVGDPFAFPHKINLSVPEESFEAYRNAPYWKDFYSINGDTGIAGIESHVAKVCVETGMLYVESERVIEKIEIYHTIGTCICSEYIHNDKWQLPTSKLPVGLLFVKIFTTDGGNETFKILI